jgi:tetratricopeptide (TPR) repeat protein
MTSAFETDTNWDRISAELRAQRTAQHQAWGDIDNTTLGRYLADEVSQEERTQIEQAIDELPELRKLTDLVRDVLSDFQPLPVPVNPVSLPQPLPMPYVQTQPLPAAQPRVLPFAPRAQQATNRQRGWFGSGGKQRAALVAAACLMLTLGLWVQMPTNSSQSGGGFAWQMSPPQAKLTGTMERTLVSAQKVNGPWPAAMATPSVAALDQMDRDLEDLQDRGQTDRALDRAAQLPELTRKAKLAENPRLALTLNRVGQLHEKNNDLNQAEAHYAKAYAICQKNLTPDCPETVQSVRNLGNTYQLALNQAPEPIYAPAPLAAQVASKSVHSAPSADLIRGHQEEFMRDKDKRNLADKIVHQPQRELRKAVVPVLVCALQHSQTTEERLGYLQALGRLGPVARDAVPVLAERLSKTEANSEREAILATLGQMGPCATEQAVPVLQRELKNHSRNVRRLAAKALLNYGLAGMTALREAAACNDLPQKETAREILYDATRLNGKHMVISIQDSGELFTLAALESVQRPVPLTARNDGLSIDVQTLEAVPSGETAASLSNKLSSAKESVSLLLCREPPLVLMRVGDAWRKRGLDQKQQKQLQGLVEKHLQNQTYDDGLQQSIQFLVEHLNK